MESAILLLKVMLINVILSGDNAVVIALAGRNLPTHLRQKAVLFGSAGAVVLRILLAVVAVWLLAIPYLQFVGGLLLIWIAFALLLEEDAAGGVRSHDSLAAAMKTIIVADVVMSLDNTLAIAAVANGDLLLLGIGLAMSVPLIIFGSQLITQAMERFPAIVYAGAGLIAWTAGEMVVGDKSIGAYLPAQVTMTLPTLATLAVLLGGWWYNLWRGRTAANVLAADEHAAARLADRID